MMYLKVNHTNTNMIVALQSLNRAGIYLMVISSPPPPPSPSPLRLTGVCVRVRAIMSRVSPLLHTHTFSFCILVSSIVIVKLLVGQLKRQNFMDQQWSQTILSFVLMIIDWQYSRFFTRLTPYDYTQMVQTTRFCLNNIIQYVWIHRYQVCSLFNPLFERIYHEHEVILNNFELCCVWIWGSHSSVHEQYGLLGSNTV
jgi:hypothetical protein